MTEEPQKNSVSIKITGLRINSLNGIIFKEKIDVGLYRKVGQMG